MTLKDVRYKAAYVSGVDNLVQDFYIPTLSQSVLYQRRTGYFNSRALAMAGRGLSGLIKKGGKMQLLCSVQLDRSEEEVLKDPVSYVERRSMDLLSALEQPYDELEKKRFGLLAEMLHRGLLEIRVVWQQGGIYHEKAGIFTDKDDNIVAFNGSGNETPGGWVNNTESFHVFTSWEDDRHIRPEIETFDRLWNGRDPKVTVIPLPFAIVKKLIQFRDYFKEKIDEPMDPFDFPLHRFGGWEWTPTLSYIFDAPRLWNHADFAYGETAIKPYEHQDYVASAVLAEWPPRFMLCDEVGLGKTIEAGLIIKGFLAAGRIDRLLILAPKHILKQWQGELLRKFGIEVWRLDGNFVFGPQFFSDTPPEKELTDAANPFRSKPLLIAGSELVRSDARRDQVLGLEYDLVIVDEAHHARARGRSGKRESNRLLDVLEELRFHTQGMLLLTATPIQLDRRELWDLLNIIELPGRWQDERLFDDFFSSLNSDEPDWKFLFDMVQEFIKMWGVDEKSIEELASTNPRIYDVLRIMKDSKVAMISSLSDEDQKMLKLLLYRHTPVYKLVFRNGRELLKRYKQEGKFSGKIAERVPVKDTIELKGSAGDPQSERGLYDRIDKYVTDFYARYNGIRQGLGFLMETYRKRLTSSLYAIKESLGRRHQLLGKALETEDYTELIRGLDEDERLDLPDDVYDEFVADEEDKPQEGSILRWAGLRDLVQEEYDYLDSFIRDLQDLPSDSKAAYLDDLLMNIRVSGSRRVIIFSQFKDTVTFLLNYFKDRYGDNLGSYTGDGGRFWRNNKWNDCSKVAIEEKFRDDIDPLTILICTDAASEGLNLQSCDTLINYDIPWNPMRIEQRIGRVDRIGQESPKVFVHTLFYKDTVEEKVYSKCLERIGYFKSALGHVQPILQYTEDTIRKAALANTKEKRDEILGKIDEEIESVAQMSEDIDIDQIINHYRPQLPQMTHKIPITQQELMSALAPRLSSAGWREEGPLWKRNDEAITFEPSLPDLKDIKVKVVLPQYPLPQLFGNLPPIPQNISNEKNTVNRVAIDRYIGYILQSEKGFHIIRKISDFMEFPAKAHRTLDEAKSFLKTEFEDKRKANREAESKAWNNRLSNWKSRCKMYLDRISAWRIRMATSEGILSKFDPTEIKNDWRQYLDNIERKTTKQLSDMIGYEPATDGIRKPRGKPSKISPKDTRKERIFLDEYEKISQKIRNLSGGN